MEVNRREMMFPHETSLCVACQGDGTGVATRKDHLGWPGVIAYAGYGDNATFRLELAARGWQYVVAVMGTTAPTPVMRSR
jgi:hypothetical protein